MLEDDRTGADNARFADEAYGMEDGYEDNPTGSLTDDLLAFFDDGKTYVEAEVAFQKTRLAFTLRKGRNGALFGIVAFALLHLALVALVVGSVIALSPLLTPMGATLLVTAILVLAALLCVRMAKRRFSALSDAYKDTRR